MAKEKQPDPAKSTVRVRVRMGAQIKTGKDEYARGGEWIEADPRDLKIASFRAAVETEEDIARAKAPAQAKAEGSAAVEAQFDQLRTAAHSHMEATKRANETIERKNAEGVLAQQGAAE